MHFGVNTWTDVITERMGARLVSQNLFPADAVIEDIGDITDILKEATGSKFAVIAPQTFNVTLGVEGGGAEFTSFNGSYRIDVCMRQMERERRATKLLSSRSNSLAILVRDVIKALQEQPLPLAATDVAGDEQSPFFQPMRLTRFTYNARNPAAGWAYCRTEWATDFTTDFTA